MNFTEKKDQLVGIITDILVPLIINDFVLMDLPHHANIGDILIWEGELQFIKQYLKNYKLLYTCSMHNCSYPKLNNNTIIMLHGGGNFGDIWYSSQLFRKKILKKYPYNKIIILPQTVWYDNEKLLLEDASFFSKHKNVTICARDKISYEILKKHFAANTVLMIPDMAFCIPGDQLGRYRSKRGQKTLFLKRTDKELNNTIDYSQYITETELDIHDWPSKEKMVLSNIFMRGLSWISKIIPILFPVITNIYATYIYKPKMIKTGVKFVKKYEKVYTTRLHTAILCCLLEKKCTFFDNSYGKNSSFYKTWLSDLKGIDFI